jgi:hypothetical protein
MRLVSPSDEVIAQDGYIERFTPVPSSGGRHPFTLLLIANAIEGLGNGGWIVREAQETKLIRPSWDPDITETIDRAVMAALRASTAAPAVLVLLGRERRVTSKYINGESLLWRDAGACVATAHLLAHDIGLASTIVGVASSAQIRIPGTKERLVDMGALAFGNRVSND